MQIRRRSQTLLNSDKISGTERIALAIGTLLVGPKISSTDSEKKVVPREGIQLNKAESVRNLRSLLISHPSHRYRNSNRELRTRLATSASVQISETLTSAVA